MTDRVATLPTLIAALHRGAAAAHGLAAPGSAIAQRLALARDALADALDEVERRDGAAEAARRTSEARRAIRVVAKNGDVVDLD